MSRNEVGIDVSKLRTPRRLRDGDRLPLQTPLPPEAVIRYRVPYIEHFYQTVRLDSKELRPDAADPCWINVCPRENS